MKRTQDDLNRIYSKLALYQQEIAEVNRTIDWNIKQKALIRQRVQNTEENLEKQKTILKKMETSLGQIISVYTDVERRLAERCENMDSSIDAASFPAEARSYLENIDWEKANVKAVLAQVMLMSQGRWDVIAVSRWIEEIREWALSRKQVLSWISEIDDAGTRTLLAKNIDYAKTIEETYHSASGTARELYDKYQDEMKIVSMDSETSYHRNGELYLNAESGMKDPRGADIIYYHETGHFIVAKEGWVDGHEMSPEFQRFDQAVKDDVSDYIARIEAEQRAKLTDQYSGNQLEAMVEQKTAEHLKKQLGGENRHILNGVSDMIDAASNGKYNITYGHGDGYWDANSTRQANEAFAHMYSSDFCNDTVETEFMRTHFPNAYREYETLKNSALGK